MECWSLMRKPEKNTELYRCYRARFQSFFLISNVAMNENELFVLKGRSDPIFKLNSIRERIFRSFNIFWRTHLFLIFLWFFSIGTMAQTSSLVSIGNDGKLIYKADSKGNVIPDFSGVGYMNGEVAIPDVPVVLEVKPVDGDNKANVQNAIDQVAAMPLQPNGFRGAILFRAGTYNMATSVTVSASGIVLRGEGDQTVFRANGTSQYDLIKIMGASGKSNITATQKQITDTYMALGAKKATVQSGHSFQPGDWVHVRREPNDDWISMLGMDLLCLDPSGEATNWTASGYKISFERQVKAVDGNVITFDAPFVDIIDPKYAKGFVVKFTSARIKNCAVEHMKIVSTYTATDDEVHGWIAININKAEHCWVRNVNCFYFGNTAVNVGSDASFVTVDNCSMIDPMSITTGGRKYSFNMDGNRNLIQNCVSRGGRHDFVNGSRTPGPNVFYNCVATQSTSESGPHHRWSTGILYDNVETNYAIAAKNREYSGSGHGWAGSQIMMWNCKAGRVIVEDPQGDHVNWAIGCIAPQVGDEGQDPVGIVESKGTFIAAIPSLYHAQLNERLKFQRGTTSVTGILPEKTNRLQVVPAVFTQSASLKYTLSAAANPTLVLYSIDGKKIREIRPGFQDAGNHRLTLHREDLPRGIYIIRLVSAQNQDSTKFIVRD